MEKETKQEEKSYSELERIEDKYVIDLKNFEEIKAELEKNLDPAYPDPKTTYCMINTIYLDSNDRAFFRHHIYGLPERIKIRYRKYGPDGRWNNKEVFLELKEKINEDIKKTRVQLDKDNLDSIKAGGELSFNPEFEKLNDPLYTHSDLKRFISKYNDIVTKHHIKPVTGITYKRLAYGKGSLRVTLDTGIVYKPEAAMALSTATQLKKAVDWDTAKTYAKKYDKNENAILEIKHETNRLPQWLKDLISKHNLEPTKFSKYVWATANNIKEIVDK